MSKRARREEVSDFLRPCRPGALCSITVMSGGKFVVEANDWKNFLRARALAIEQEARNGYRDCYSEIFTLPHHFAAVDIDLKVNSPRVAATFPWIEVARLVQKGYVAALGVQPAKTTAVISTTPPRRLEGEDEGKTKLGMHINFPYLVIDFADELEARSKTLPGLQKLLDALEQGLDAETVYDGSIYVEGKGLRMLCAYKGDVGPDGRPLFDSSRRYTILSVLDRFGAQNEKMTLHLKENLFSAMLNTSVRSFSANTLLAPTRGGGGADAAPLGRTPLCMHSCKIPIDFYDLAAELHPALFNTKVVDTKFVNNPRLFRRGYALKLDNFKNCIYKGSCHSTSTLYLFLDLFGRMYLRCYSQKCKHHNWRIRFVDLPQELLDRMGWLNSRGLPIGCGLL